MFEAIGGLLGRISIYVAVALGLVAVYFLWVAFREWRARVRAVFGVERDVATSEMMGAVSRAGILILIGIVVFGLGWLGQQSESEEASQTSRTPAPTTSVIATVTPGSGEPGPAVLPTDTLQPVGTDVPPLPEEPTETPALEPTPQTATVSVFGGVWLRDAPNGGTIDVLPQDSVVELLEGRQVSGNFEWQEVRVLDAPLGSEALVGREGWVASEFLQVGP
jgi:hypothetical protein